MSKFTRAERNLIQSIVAGLSIKRIPDQEIMNEVFRQTHKTITAVSLFYIRKKIKKEGYKWYSITRQGQYEYIHEFRERINEVIWLQQKHHQIIESNKNNPTVQQASLNELHKLNITLANYFDILHDVLNGSSISKSSQEQESAKTEQQQRQLILV